VTSDKLTRWQVIVLIVHRSSFVVRRSSFVVGSTFLLTALEAGGQLLRKLRGWYLAASARILARPQRREISAALAFRRP
jgi:hypothetical protein